MFISQYLSRTGKGKVIANEEMGRRGPENDAHLKTSSLMCRVPSLTTVSEKEKKDHVVFCRTPLPHRDLTRFYKDPPPLADHMFCVPCLLAWVFLQTTKVLKVSRKSKAAS